MVKVVEEVVKVVVDVVAGARQEAQVQSLILQYCTGFKSPKHLLYW